MLCKCTTEDKKFLISNLLNNKLRYYKSAVLAILAGLVALGTLYDLHKIGVKYYHNNIILNTQILIVENQVETAINDDEKERLIEVYHNESKLSLNKHKLIIEKQML